MTDICVFYARDDRRRVAPLVNALKSEGWTVFWDKDLHQGNWDERVEKEIQTCLCVIPVWTSKSIKHNQHIRSEATYAKDHGKPLFPVQLDELKLPVQFNNLSTIKLIGWDGATNHPGIAELLEHLESTFRLGLRDAKNARAKQLTFGRKSITLPCFARSVSSYETQLPPTLALEALSLYPSPIPILVSAYDTYVQEDATSQEKFNHNQILSNLKELDSRGCFILLDSGNYEAYRKGEDVKVCSDEGRQWGHEKFVHSLLITPFDFAFCYDDLNPPNSIKAIVDKVVSSVQLDQKEGETDRILPIVHAPRNPDGSHKTELLPEVIFGVAQELTPPIIAVPERELGEGIVERARNIHAIRQALSTLNYYQPLHLLGTGNPISIAMFSAAGADLFDGLEWCRTVAERNTGLLYHHQQFDFFRDQSKESEFDILRNSEWQQDLNFLGRMALHNLDVFNSWMDEVQDRTHDGTISEMLVYSLSKSIVINLKKQIPEVFEL